MKKRLIIWWQMKLWNFQRLHSTQARSGKRVTYKFDDDGTAVEISSENRNISSENQNISSSQKTGVSLEPIISPDDLQQTLRNAGWIVDNISGWWCADKENVRVYGRGQIVYGLKEHRRFTEEYIIGQYTPEKAVEIALLLRP